MKKTLALFLLSFGLLSSNYIAAEGCFHDAINVVDKAGYVTQGARIRNVACMDGSAVLATLAKGTKVRIIGQTAWTKIVMPDGRVGWIGNNYIAEASDRASVPSFPNGHAIDSYCDTTNPLRCPYPSAPGAQPDRYYLDQAPSGSSQPTYQEPAPVVIVPKQIQLTDVNKAILDNMAAQFIAKIESKYEGSLDLQISNLEVVVAGLEIFAKKSYKMALLIEYLKNKIDEQLGVKQLQKLLNVN